MKTKNIIQASVNVIKLVNLKRGDIFKIVGKDEYSSGGISYNVVLELYNTGEDSFLEVIQYKKSYSDVEATHKVFEGTDDIAIFPATIEEVSEYFDSAIKKLSEKVADDKESLHKEVLALDKAKEFASGELSKNIQVAEFKEQNLMNHIKGKAKGELMYRYFINEKAKMPHARYIKENYTIMVNPHVMTVGGKKITIINPNE